MTEKTAPKKMKAADRLIFLNALREGGIDALFLPSENKPGPKPVQVAAFTGEPPATPPPAKKISDQEANPVRDAMIAMRNETLACTKCSELSSTRNEVVFGSGNIRARLVFVGEAPGADEDEQGIPFVGRSGALLTKMIEAMGLTRKDVFICNVLKCRPPENRPPKPDEKTNCKPFLLRQLELIKPDVICALGTHAAQSLLETDLAISDLRNQVHKYAGIDLVCTFHPSYLLRSPSTKKEAWADLQKVMALLHVSSEQSSTAGRSSSGRSSTAGAAAPKS